MSFDVLVVGAGPAGSSTAFQLARAGVRVAVVERSGFPRPKPCAECLSPQASAILAEMGALETLETWGAWLSGMVVRSPDGVVARGDYEARHGFSAYRGAGLSVRREILDTELLSRAQCAGAELIRGRVGDVIRGSGGRVTGIVMGSASGGTTELRAPVVVAADGLRSVIARRLQLARRTAWPDRISVVAHYAGVQEMTSYGEMHVERDGFVGIARVGGGITTVAAVFPRARARTMAGNPGAFLDGWLSAKPQLRERFACAQLTGRAAAVGPFASHARRAWHPGALLVGDAADFFDPFTGEGIYAALQGGQFAATAARAALEQPRHERAAFEHYEQRRRTAFRGKWMVERIIGACVASPALVNRATRALAGRKELADLLVGVTGDFVPPSRVLRLGYLARLFVLPIPSIS